MLTSGPSLKRSLSPESLPESANTNEPRYSSIKSILETPWSPEMADTLRTARRIAFDAHAAHLHLTSGISLIEEVIFLASTVQKNLDVIYLVDYCVEGANPARNARLSWSDLQTRGGVLNLDLHGTIDTGRKPDIILGIGTVLREVFDLEGLGWVQHGIMHLFAKVLGTQSETSKPSRNRTRGNI